MNTLNQTMLRNLIIERELCIAKIQFVTERLRELEEKIEEQRKLIKSESNDTNNGT